MFYEVIITLRISCQQSAGLTITQSIITQIAAKLIISTLHYFSSRDVGKPTAAWRT